MKDDYKKHLFVPSRNSTIDTLADVVDKKVSNIEYYGGREHSSMLP